MWLVISMPPLVSNRYVYIDYTFDHYRYIGARHLGTSLTVRISDATTLLSFWL